MEERLKLLFDFQRFEGNERMKKLISETENRNRKMQALTDEELSLINAAGEPFRPQKN